MPDYKQMYLTIIRAANNALELNQKAVEHIIAAQQQAEEMYIEVDDTPLSIVPSNSDEQEQVHGRIDLKKEKRDESN